jgi:hypothetical protein
MVVMLLDDQRIVFIDNETGVPCQPWLDLAAPSVHFCVSDDLVICMTQDGILQIWDVVPGEKIRLVFKQRFAGPLPPIEKIELEIELQDFGLSPVLYTPGRTLRFSPRQNGWVMYNMPIPAFFKPAGPQTTGEAMAAFDSALMFHDRVKFEAVFPQLLNTFNKSLLKNRAMALVKSLLTYSELCPCVCGLPSQEVLREALELLGVTKNEVEQWNGRCNRARLSRKLRAAHKESSAVSAHEESSPEREHVHR